MGDKVEQTLATTTLESKPTQPEKKKPVNLDEFDEFKKYKSSVDKKQNETLAALDAERQSRVALEERLESIITDPTAKAQMKTDRLEHQLEYYKTQENLYRQREVFASRWGIPETVLSNSSNPSEMTEAALDYLKQVADGKVTVQLTEEKQREVDRLTTLGAHEVSTATGAAPVSASAAVSEKYASTLKDLKERARKGDANARVEIYKLQAEIQNSQKSVRAQV